MQLSDGIVTLLIFIATQTGALIFFAGVVAFTLKDHSRRLNIIEMDAKEDRKTVSQLAVKEG